MGGISGRQIEGIARAAPPVDRIEVTGHGKLRAMRANSAQWDCGHSGLDGLSGQKAHRLLLLVSPVDSRRLAGGPIKKAQPRAPPPRRAQHRRASWAPAAVLHEL